MYKFLMKIDRYLTRTAETVLTILFIAIFIMVFYQVILRYVFNTSIFGTAEVFTMLFAYASSLGSAVMVRTRGHIKISIFIDRLPVPWRKIILSLDYLLIAVFSYFIVDQSIPWLKSIRLFKSQVTGISRAVESIMIPIGFGLIIFYCFINIISLYLSPEEADKEFSSGELEITTALEDAKWSKKPDSKNINGEEFEI